MPATFNVKVCDEKYFSGNFYSAEAAAFNFIAAVGRKLSCGIVRADVETEVVREIKISHQPPQTVWIIRIFTLSKSISLMTFLKQNILTRHPKVSCLRFPSTSFRI